MRVTEAEADLIRASFRAVGVDSHHAAEVFYQHLFAADPALRRLFVTDMRRQGVKLMSTLGLIAAQVQDWELLMPMVEDLAMRHLAYGVEARHYPLAGAALQAMLETVLEEAFTPAVASAWARAFTGLQDAMVAAAYPPADEAEAGL